MRWFTLFVILLCCSPLWAMPFGYNNDDSIELAAAESDLIVVGKIISVEPDDPPGAQPMSGYIWTKATVQVSETLLGEHQPTISFWQPEEIPPAGRTTYRQWPTRYVCLICLVKGDRYRRQAEPYYQDIPLTLWGNAHPWGAGFWNLEWFPYTVRWDKAVDSNALSHPELLKEVLQPYLHRPMEAITDTALITDGHGSTFRVPVIAYTEALAREWAASDGSTRMWDAFQILQLRTTPQNIAALKALIARPVDTECKEILRERVIQQLKDWGETFQDPIRVPSAPIIAWRELSFWLSLLALFAAPCTYAWLWRRDRISIHGYWRIASMAWLVAASIVAVIWARSYLGLDAFSYHEWSLGASDGNLLLSQRGNSDLVPNWPLAYCRVSALPTLNDVAQEHWKYLPDSFTESRCWKEFFCKDRDGWYSDPRHWHDVNTWRLPLWMPAAALCLLALLGWSGHWTRRFKNWLRARRTRGFPVALQS